MESASEVSGREALPLQSEIGALDSELRGKKNSKYYHVAEVNRHFTCLCEKISQLKLQVNYQMNQKSCQLHISLFKLFIPGITLVFSLV